MDTLEINKIIAAGLVGGIAFFMAGFVGDLLVHEEPLKQAAIKIDVAPPPGAKPAETPDPPIAALLASADPKKGQALTQQVGCVACHSFNEGGQAGVGPNLYNVVGAPHGHEGDYAYSAALKGKPGDWTFDALNEWLKKPSAYAPGTKMSFAGLADPKQRADIIDYLHTLSPNPVPLPAAPAAATAAATASASGAAPPPAAGATPPASFDALLASADPGAGKADTAKLGCVACHSFNEGGKAGVGPNLYGVVGAPHGHMEGYAYSAALKGKEGPWTTAELDKWLEKPAAYAPGTKMTFAGVPDAKTRAEVIAYLETLGAKGQPAPKAEAGAPPSAPPPVEAPAKQP